QDFELCLPHDLDQPDDRRMCSDELERLSLAVECVALRRTGCAAADTQAHCSIEQEVVSSTAEQALAAVVVARAIEAEPQRGPREPWFVSHRRCLHRHQL